MNSKIAMCKQFQEINLKYAHIMSNKSNMHKVSPSPTPYLNITVSSLYKNKGKERDSLDRCAEAWNKCWKLLQGWSISSKLVDVD